MVVERKVTGGDVNNWNIGVSFYRYSLSLHVTRDGHIDVKKNKEEVKNFCDKFCQLMVDAIQEGEILEMFIITI